VRLMRFMRPILAHARLDDVPGAGYAMTHPFAFAHAAADDWRTALDRVLESLGPQLARAAAISASCTSPTRSTPTWARS